MLTPAPEPVTVTTVPLGIFDGVSVQIILPPLVVQVSLIDGVNGIALTCKGRIAFAVCPVLSFTATATENDPLADGVPDSRPFELIERTAGAEPENV